MAYRRRMILNKIHKIAISLQRGNAYVIKYLKTFDYEYDDKIQSILKDKNLSREEKEKQIENRIRELFWLIPDEDIDIKSTDWDIVKIDSRDVEDLIDNYEEYLKLKEEEKKSSLYKKSDLIENVINLLEHDFDQQDIINELKHKFPKKEIIEAINYAEELKEEKFKESYERRYE